MGGLWGGFHLCSKLASRPNNSTVQTERMIETFWNQKSSCTARHPCLHMFLPVPPPKKNRPIGVGRDAYQGCQHKPLLATGILGRGHTENYSRQNSARENIQKAARGKLMYPCPVFHHPSRVRLSNRSAKILFVCGPSRVKTIHQNNDIRITKYLANI